MLIIMPKTIKIMENFKEIDLKLQKNVYLRDHSFINVKERCKHKYIIVLVVLSQVFLCEICNFMARFKYIKKCIANFNNS